MCVGALSLVAAVPIGIEDEPPPFWLTRIFGSGRRKRKSSRDIGTSINEAQLLLETPPASPSSARSPALPDLITSCSPPPSAASSSSGSLLAAGRSYGASSVFVFPDSSAHCSACSPPTASASAAVPGDRLMPTVSELPAEAAVFCHGPLAARSSGCPFAAAPPNGVGYDEQEQEVVGSVEEAGSQGRRRRRCSARVVSSEVRDAAAALRACADQLQLQQQLRQQQQYQLPQLSSSSSSSPLSSPRRSEHLSQLVAACCVLCVAAGCVCRLWSSN